MSEADKKRGFYNKYHVERLDGTSNKDGKHDGCRYLVLDLTHLDDFSRAAVEAYADACKAEYPFLATDLLRLSSKGGKP